MTPGVVRATSSTSQSPGEPVWYFPSTDNGEDQGFSDAQLEYFQGDHEKYVAREAIQNAVDARLDEEIPVSVVFERFSIEPTSLPGHAELLTTLGRCLEYTKEQANAERFLKNAISVLGGPSVPVLKISDFNTKGLTGGDREVSGNWYRLVKAAGTSSPKGVAGGSFGIGKGAPIAASNLHTVFYSSINDAGEPVCQGKARLVSHHDETGDVRQGVGFFGIGGYNAIRDAAGIPSMFRREGRGTDVFVIGYRSGDDWKEKLVRSVLNNFWLAIHSGNLEVTLRDSTELVISKATLEHCLNAFDAPDARIYYDTFTSSTSHVFERDTEQLGIVRLIVKKDAHFPGKIMMARSPQMVVVEKVYRVLREPYAGVLTCENPVGNKILRDLEPPAHDKWDPARAPNGRAVWRELDAFVKESLKTLAEAISTEAEDIPGLSRYLPDADDRDFMPSEPATATEESSFSARDESAREVGAQGQETSVSTTAVRRKAVVSVKRPGKVRVRRPEGPGDGGGGGGAGDGDGDLDGLRINTSSIGFRSFVQQDATGLSYHVVLRASEDCEGSIRLVGLGDDAEYPLNIEAAKDESSGASYSVASSTISGLKIDKGKSAKLALRLGGNKRYVIGVEAYDN